MATSISGSVALSYGQHNHSESFSTTSAALTYANPIKQYAAGGGRAVLTAAALDVGTIVTGTDAEGLLLIKNTNTAGHLLVSLNDTGGVYSIRIPAGVANLISVGTSGAVFLKTDTIQQAGKEVASVTSAGVITFDGVVPTAGTYMMKATANPNDSSGPSFIMKTTTDASLTGTVYELDGVTKKDLAGVGGYGTATEVLLDAVVDYRYTLTEA